jgi:hypothetical protein
MSRNVPILEAVALMKDCLASAQDKLTLSVKPEERKTWEQYIHSLEQAIADAERCADAEKAAKRQ